MVRQKLETENVFIGKGGSGLERGPRPASWYIITSVRI